MVTLWPWARAIDWQMDWVLRKDCLVLQSRLLLSVVLVAYFSPLPHLCSSSFERVAAVEWIAAVVVKFNSFLMLKSKRQVNLLYFVVVCLYSRFSVVVAVSFLLWDFVIALKLSNLLVFGKISLDPMVFLCLKMLGLFFQNPLHWISHHAYDCCKARNECLFVAYHHFFL